MVQADLLWENPSGNRAQLEEYLKELSPDSSDLILFPEMFTTGFSMGPKSLAEKMGGPTLQWMADWAARLETVVAGSLIIEEEGSFYNRFVFVFPDGSVQHYDKRHLFTLAGEHIPYTPGEFRTTVDIKGWRILPQVCYDLRFPVWSRNDLGYDLAIYVANWPSPRKEAWRTLLQARAIENQSYVIGVNRIGNDPNDLNYDGLSAMIEYSGKRLLELDQPDMHTVSLNKSELDQFRSKLDFLADQDEFFFQA
ncbi:MAG: amidohydrolase [Saprospiraceae bacterium]|nr:amidohydrolase [Saprospiraceae bacterium]